MAAYFPCVFKTKQKIKQNKNKQKCLVIKTENFNYFQNRIIFPFTALMHRL